MANDRLGAKLHAEFACQVTKLWIPHAFTGLFSYRDVALGDRGRNRCWREELPFTRAVSFPWRLGLRLRELEFEYPRLRPTVTPILSAGPPGSAYLGASSSVDSSRSAAGSPSPPQPSLVSITKSAVSIGVPRLLGVLGPSLTANNRVIGGSSRAWRGARRRQSDSQGT